MAGSVLATPGYDLQPSAQQVPTSTNYITDFDFLNQYLPDTYEKEFERYGNRTVSGFLSLVGAEMPMASDEVVWSEQGRIHVAYEGVTMLDESAQCKISFPTGTFGASSAASPNHNLKVGDTVVLAHDYKTLKCYDKGSRIRGSCSTSDKLFITIVIYILNNSFNSLENCISSASICS